MDMQLDLFGGGSALAPRSGGRAEHRYYFSLVPPPLHAQNIERGAQLLARRYGARNPVRADRLHVSLNGIRRGTELDQERLDDALEVGMSVRRPGFDIVFDTVQTFAGAALSKTGGRSQVPTVLTCSNGAREAIALYGDIRREMQRRGMNLGPPAFTPHLTLWYGPERVPDLPLKRPFRWPVRQFWLVHTVAGQKRPEYIEEWPLGR